MKGSDPENWNNWSTLKSFDNKKSCLTDVNGAKEHWQLSASEPEH